MNAKPRTTNYSFKIMKVEERVTRKNPIMWNQRLIYQRLFHDNHYVEN